MASPATTAPPDQARASFRSMSLKLPPRSKLKAPQPLQRYARSRSGQIRLADVRKGERKEEGALLCSWSRAGLIGVAGSTEFTTASQGNGQSPARKA